MKQLNFIIDGQKLTRTDALEIVSDAIGQFEAVFSFDEWWDGFTPTAQFTKDGKTIDCILEDNKCVVPPEALQGGGIFYVNVFSTDGTGDRKTANEVAVPLKASGYKADGSHSVKPTPTIYEQLLKKMDENTVMNGDGVVASPNADFAEVAEWSDGNPDNEDRIGYFVCFDVPTSGIIMRKANADDDVKGVTVLNPSFAGNCTKDKFDENGKLLPQYEYVGVIGLVPVHDNGQCVVGERCVPADGGLAAPSPNDKGYQVVERYNDNMILIAVEPNGDMVYRLQEQIDALSGASGGSGISAVVEEVNAGELDYGVYYIDGNNGGCVNVPDNYFVDGTIFVSPSADLGGKQVTICGISSDYLPIITSYVFDEDGNYMDIYDEFVSKTYVDTSVRVLQKQIDELKNTPTIHTEIELNNKGDLVFSWYRDNTTKGDYTKTNDGWCIVGSYAKSGSGTTTTYFATVGKTPESVATSGNAKGNGTVAYNKVAYYYNIYQVSTSYVTNYGNAVRLGAEYADNESFVKDLLDYYYGVS